MQEFKVSFGLGGRNGGGYVTVFAEDEEQAREWAFRKYGRESIARFYQPEHEMQARHFPLGEIGRFNAVE